MAAPRTVDGVEAGNTETGLTLSNSSSGDPKRPQFGTRFLTDPRQVFQHNAWDNVEWTDEQEEAAKKKVLENNQPLPPEKQASFLLLPEEYDSRASEYWNGFYTIHENRFFKDRHWLFTEFPELAPLCNPNHALHPNALGMDISQQDEFDQKQCRDFATLSGDNVDFPGSSATYRILEVRDYSRSNDPGLFVYCCDFSSTAVELVKGNPEYDSKRCFAFVHDLSEVEAGFPIPDGTLDVIVLIFVLSALHPDKYENILLCPLLSFDCCIHVALALMHCRHCVRVSPPSQDAGLHQ
ncbi:hypothetical protein XENOCAPTIV_009802 [Xenoophorus captivus]|uniref:Methyltransferase-like protein n=1 Tax=Xenoophorus captivus TaxID=1517983 RepID=A0ABV0QW31_9TELE